MTAESTVSGMITDAQNFANTAFNESLSYISQAVTAASGFATVSTPGFNFSTNAITTPDIADAPAAFNDVFRDQGAVPDVPVFQELLVPSLPDFPDAPVALDTSNLFQTPVPVYDINPFAETPPDIDTNLSVPPRPTLNFPAEPQSTPVTVRPAPVPTVPRFTAQFQGTDPGPPPDIAQALQDTYRQSVPEFKAFVDAGVDEWMRCYAPDLKNQAVLLAEELTQALVTNSPLDEKFEEGLYNRARTRVEAQRNRQVEEVTRAASKRGFQLPPGAVTGGLNQATQAASNQIAQSANEIAVERAKLEYQFKQFILQLSQTAQTQAQQTLIQYAGVLLNVNSQALEYARQVASALAEGYNLVRERFMMHLELYKTLAQVYETEIKSAFADLEAYKIELEGIKLQKDVDRLDVEIFAQKINAIKVRVDVYSEELRGLKIQSDLELSKIQIFESLVRAYLGQVQAKEAEFRAYAAAISGDEAQVRAHAQIVAAFREEVNAGRAVLDAEIARTTAGNEFNRNLVAQFQAEISAFEATLRAESSRFEGSVDAHKEALRGYQIDTQAKLETLRSELEISKQKLLATQSVFEGELKVALSNAELGQNAIKVRADTTIAAAQVSEGIASSALSSQNSIVSLVNETTQEG